MTHVAMAAKFEKKSAITRCNVIE